MRSLTPRSGQKVRAFLDMIGERMAALPLAEQRRVLSAGADVLQRARRKARRRRKAVTS